MVRCPEQPVLSAASCRGRRGMTTDPLLITSGGRLKAARGGITCSFCEGVEQ
ncbi:hypothetical protein J6590_050394 [Homalodisca vitripennis]|nr:hypothetical protein J6590_050394 [Homalodisca vitripennis]